MKTQKIELKQTVGAGNLPTTLQISEYIPQITRKEHSCLSLRLSQRMRIYILDGGTRLWRDILLEN